MSTSDIQITWRKDLLSKMAKQMLAQCIKVNILGDPVPKIESGLCSGRTSARDTIIKPNLSSFQQNSFGDVDSSIKSQIIS